jgi:hypothetical protein
MVPGTSILGGICPLSEGRKVALNPDLSTVGKKNKYSCTMFLLIPFYYIEKIYIKDAFIKTFIGEE